MIINDRTRAGVRERWHDNTEPHARVLGQTRPEVLRGFRVPLYPYTPVFALISCIVLAFYLNPNAVMIAVIFLATGIVVYSLTRRGREEEMAGSPEPDRPRPEP